jgi:pyruvate dehydrogenase E2 component (dihydrolipoamide acetyltransferase)
MPQLAMGSDEVVLREWLLGPGDEFEAGQAILEIETDKATMEVEAPEEGMLVGLRCDEGDTVPVGAVIGHFAPRGTDLAEAIAALPAPEPDGGTAPAPAGRDGATASAPIVPVAAGDGAAAVSFVVVEHGELAGLPSAPPRTATPPAEPDGREAAGPARTQQLSRRRIVIGRRMAAAAAIPTFVVARDIAAEAAKARVAAARAEGLRVTFTDVLLQACGAAAAAHPAANAWLSGDELLEFEHVNVALAVDAPGGVVAPVIRGVEALSLADVAHARSDLVDRARSGALAVRELAGGTMTLSNVAGLGAHGITPVLTAPQTVALGVGAARTSGGREAIAVTFVGDHRALDGADGARFLQTFADALDSTTVT